MRRSLPSLWVPPHGYYREGADSELDEKVNQLRAYLRTNRAKQNLYNRTWLLWAATKMPGLLNPEERKNIIAEMQSQQQQDGGWRLASLGEYKRNDATPQETASDGYATGLILHVLQTVGLPKDEPSVSKGLGWLRRNQMSSGAWVGYSVNKKREPESPNEAKAACRQVPVGRRDRLCRVGAERRGMSP